ncbi:MAG TPA: RibD family protein [Desulfurivibrio alkaliphilus]|uniref:RibD family protein n=1 Tax=Desulfurivibrio alkaliphilus TaxID=427923 RepID=A0A7C2XSC7_9BACT|nr:RibD family protein [Desulfurivibrio alkaliphilus]
MKTLLIAAMTLCGRISPAGLGSPEDRRFLEEMRAKSQAGVMGAGTLRAEDVEMRGPQGQWPIGRIRALVSASGRVPATGRKIFQTGPPPLIFTGERGAKHLKELSAIHAELVIIPEKDGVLSLAAAWDFLAGRGVKQLLVEGGAGLNYQALRQGLVDELLVTITPKLSGDRSAATLVSGPQPLGTPFLDLELLNCRPTTGGELFCHYRVVK